jgi:hypothetical protein
MGCCGRNTFYQLPIKEIRTMKKIKISVMPKYTGGYVGAYAVTATFTSEPEFLKQWPWTITHVESGKSIGACADFETAEELTDLFDEFFHWLQEAEIPTQTRERIKNLLAPYQEAKLLNTR